MIKFKTLVLIFFLLVFTTTLFKETTFAQEGEGDAMPTRMFLIKDSKLDCVSIINPEEVGTDSFLVFDYSEKVGIERNQPWTIVEKGKCYEIHDERTETENFYRVKIIKGDEREVFTDYSRYSPSDNIPNIFCNRGIMDNYCNGIAIDGPVTTIYAGGSFGYAQTAHTFPDGEATALFPTKYQFYFSTGWYPKELEDLAKDPDFILAEKNYDQLTENLNETLETCDRHAKIEHQYSISHAFFEGKDHLMQNLENVIWHFNDGRRILVRYTSPLTDIHSLPSIEIQTNLLHDIYLMGCKDAYVNFTKNNSSYLTEIDTLAVRLIKKYSEIKWIPIQKRETKQISRLFSFISNPADNGYSLEKEQFDLLSKYQSEHMFIQTTVDEPTATQIDDKLPKNSNKDLVTHQNRLLYLGLIIFILIAGLVLYKKHSKA